MKDFIYIPCNLDSSGKPTKPLIAWKNTDLDSINLEELLELAPGRAIITGSRSKLTVIDIDNEEAKKALEDYTTKSINELCRYIVKTGKGYHLYYKYNPNLKTSVKVVEGIDIRNDDAIVFCPSPKSSYYTLLEPDNLELVDIPLKLVEYLTPKSLQVFEESKVKDNELAYRNPLRFIVSRMLGTSLTSSLEESESDREYVENILFGGTKLSKASQKGSRHFLTTRIYGICNQDPTIDEIFLNTEVKAFIHRYVGPDDLDKEFDSCYKYFGHQFNYDPLWEARYKEYIEESKEDDRGFSELNRRLFEKNIVFFRTAKGFSYVHLGLTNEITTFKTQSSNPSNVKSYIASVLGCPTKEVDLNQIPWIDSEKFGVIFDDSRPVGFLDVPSPIDPTKTFRGLNLAFKSECDKASKRLNYFLDNPNEAKVKSFEELPLFYRAVFTSAFKNEESRNVYLTALSQHLKKLSLTFKMLLISGFREGTGKSAVTSSLFNVLFKERAINVSEGSFLSSFNGEFAGKYGVVFDDVDEINSGAKEKAFAQKIKQFVASPKLAIHPKGGQAYMVDNRALYVMTSNAEFPVRLGSGDNRRLLLLQGGETPLIETSLWKEFLESRSLTSNDSLPNFEELFEEGLDDFLSYLSHFMSSTSFVDLNNVEFSNEAIRRGKIENPISLVEGIAEAVVRRDLEALEDLAPFSNNDDRYDKFLEAFETKILKANSPGISAREMRGYFGHLWRHLASSFRRRGIKVKNAYSKWDSCKTIRFCIINPGGSWDNVSDNGTRIESVEEQIQSFSSNSPPVKGEL